MKKAIVLFGLVSFILSGVVVTGCAKDDSGPTPPPNNKPVDPNQKGSKGDPGGNQAQTAK
ncbi:MAG TPA: hypothetical protein VKT78_08055 [Fimbriimonadaceae bacterium]|nr:hypothetical protein [Fimbriimonadaceae bacterium]